MKNVSYALGMSIANNLRSNQINDLDIEAFVNAVKATLNNEKTDLTPEEANKVLGEYFEKKQKEQVAILSKEGEEFLAENAKKEGVKVTASGLQYEVITEGNGDVPTETDRVKCHYEGTLVNGTVFDSSYKRGEPAVFGVNQVIPGWVEALQMMKVGSKYRLYIPYQLAYGEQGAGGAIPPCSALIFDVELLEIVK